MKTIEELANLGAAAALLIVTPPGSDAVVTRKGAAFYGGDQPARETFARAVRDAVLADQPAADVPTWRPIAEFPARPFDDNGKMDEYVYWDGDMAWHGDFTEKQDATHFLVPPPKPDPFEAWYARWHKVWSEDRNAARIAYDAARIAYDAAREAKP